MNKTDTFQAMLKDLRFKINAAEEKVSLADVANYMVNYYMYKYHITYECDYLRHKKSQLLFVDLIKWLLNNYRQRKVKACTHHNITPMNFKESLNKIATDLLPWKLSIIKLWKEKQFDVMLNSNIDFNKIPADKKQKYMLLKNYVPFNSNDEERLRKDLGL
jgi:hypothetical protein